MFFSLIGSTFSYLFNISSCFSFKTFTSFEEIDEYTTKFASEKALRESNIDNLKDNYRALILLKNRVGRPNLKKGLFFNGSANLFAELPLPHTSEMNEVYERIKLIKQG